MSANRRTLGLHFAAATGKTRWIYFTAPTLGMLAAAEVFLVAREGKGPYCSEAASPQPHVLHVPPHRTGPHRAGKMMAA
jgi:hypothetical protein